ncbi:hypothetical protein [Pedomonas sp. V897]
MEPSAAIASGRISNGNGDDIAQGLADCVPGPPGRPTPHAKPPIAL